MEENPTLPPRTSTQRLLFVESSLEGIYVTLTGLQESIDALTRRMEVVATTPQNHIRILLFMNKIVCCGIFGWTTQIFNA